MSSADVALDGWNRWQQAVAVGAHAGDVGVVLEINEHDVLKSPGHNGGTRGRTRGRNGGRYLLTCRQDGREGSRKGGRKNDGGGDAIHRRMLRCAPSENAAKSRGMWGPPARGFEDREIERNN